MDAWPSAHSSIVRDCKAACVREWYWKFCFMRDRRNYVSSWTFVGHRNTKKDQVDSCMRKSQETVTDFPVVSRCDIADFPSNDTASRPAARVDIVDEVSLHCNPTSCFCERATLTVLSIFSGMGSSPRRPKLTLCKACAKVTTISAPIERSILFRPAHRTK